MNNEDLTAALFMAGIALALGLISLLVSVAALILH